jgi:ferredoxin-NADP reductase
MPTPSFTFECIRSDIIAEGIYEIEFTKPEGLEFTEGQFLLLDAPLIDNPEDIQPRAYSIASSPDDDTLLLVIKLVPEGRCSTWVKEQLKTGVQTRVQCPFGKFILDPETQKEYVMMCTSTGIAPFRSQLRTLLPKGETRKIDLFFGLLNEAELFWEDELKEFAAQYPNFNYHISVAQRSENWKGFVGFVQQHASEVITDFSNKQIYICGAPIMAKAVKGFAISEWKVSKDDIHMEGFI